MDMVGAHSEGPARGEDVLFELLGQIYYVIVEISSGGSSGSPGSGGAPCPASKSAGSATRCQRQRLSTASAYSEPAPHRVRLPQPCG